MLPSDRMNQPSNLALALMELGQAFNAQTALTSNRLSAFILVLDKELPGFKDKYEKQMFTIQIAEIAGAIEQVRRDGSNDALTIISDNGEVLKRLKKQAKIKDSLQMDDETIETTWLAAYNQGIADAKEYGERLDKEALEVEEDKS